MDAAKFKSWAHSAGLCPCGESIEAVRILRDTLRVLAEFENRPERLDQILPHPGSRHILLCWLDQQGLSEHGGSVGGSWLTDEGKNMLAFLETLDESGIENVFDTVTF